MKEGLEVTVPSTTSTDKKLQDFKERLEKNLLAKLAQQKLNLGFELIKNSPDRVSLSVFDKKRPLTQFGKVQGAHTIAYSAVLRSLCLMLEDVPVSKARERLLDFHWDFYILYTLCVNSPKADCIDTIKNLADEVHQDLRLESRQGKPVSSLMTNYLTLFLYMHNLLPDAAVNMRSTNRGESSALSNLSTLNSASGTTERAKAIASLSILIDEEAVAESLRQTHYLGTPLIGFQIMGINRLLNGLPSVSKMVLGGELISPTLKDRIDDEQLISNLQNIIFHKFNDPHAVLKQETLLTGNPTHQKNRDLIKHALGWICDLQRVNYRAPYGTIARV